MSDQEKAWNGGEVVFCGGTDWALVTSRSSNTRPGGTKYLDLVHGATKQKQQRA